MSVETSNGSEPGAVLGSPLGGARGFSGGAYGRRPRTLGLPEARGLAASIRRDALFRRMLVAADMAAIIGAFALTVAVSHRSVQLTWAGVAAVPILVVCAKLTGLYDRDEALLRKTTLEEAPRLFQLATLCALVAWLTGGLLVHGALDRHEAAFLWLVLAALLMLARSASRVLSLRAAAPERCLLIGEELAAETIRARLGNSRGIRAEVVAWLDLDKAGPWSSDGFSATRLAEIRDLASTLDVHRAIIAPGWSSGEDAASTLDLVRTLKAVGVRVSVLPRMLEVVGSSVEFDDLHGVTVMGVRRFDLTRSSAAIKRSLDVLGAAIGLFVMAPLMLLITVAIKLDGPGPIFFRQLRVGRHGRRFRVIKFRTMVPEAEAMKHSLWERNEAGGGLFKIAEDPRVTRVGRLLRRSALDELPQLWNVLSGEMSLVGPRPLVLEEDQRVAGWHRRRLELMPGITGPWQILGPVRVPLGEMVAIDYLYIANWSLWSDLKILLRTVPHVLGRRGL